MKPKTAVEQHAAVEHHEDEPAVSDLGQGFVIDPITVETTFRCGETVKEDGSKVPTMHTGTWTLDFTGVTLAHLVGFTQRAAVQKMAGVMGPELKADPSKLDQWLVRTIKVSEIAYGQAKGKAKGPTLADIKAKRATMSKEAYMAFLIEAGILPSE